MFNRIMLPLDGSPFSEQALPFAMAIARHTGATLHLVSVHNAIRPEAVRPAPAVFETGFDSLIVARERTYLEALARTLEADQGLHTVTTLLQGGVAPLLATYAHESDIELVVMSTHGHGGIRRAWIGSVADRLLRRLHMPMLVVRPRSSTTPVPDFHAFANVLVALDGSATLEAAIDALAAMPRAPEATCTLLRIAFPPVPMLSAYVPDAMVDAAGELDRSMNEASDYLDGMARRAALVWPHVNRCVIGANRPAETIMQQAQEQNADLIVVGTHGRGPVRRAVIGSVADKVIRAAEAPVLVLPARALAWDRALAGDDLDVLADEI